MHVVAAPDKFRGSVTAAQAAHAIAAGAAAVGWTCREVPLADGGEGTLDALGGPNRVTRVTGPLGDPVSAGWRIDGETAVIEMARASGLAVAGGRAANKPLLASTHGTGELIAAAIAAGARQVIVGVGGSATTDGGFGALEALGPTTFMERGVVVWVACDVQTTFLDAAAVFAPQKGATVEQVTELAKRLQLLADVYWHDFGVDVTALPGSGGAGGLPGGLAALGAQLQPGFDLVADTVGLDSEVAKADFVITGEGLLDPTSFTGKVVGGVLQRATAHGIPASAVVGEARSIKEEQLQFVELIGRFGDVRAWAEPQACIAEAAESLLRAYPGRRDSRSDSEVRPRC